MACSRVFHLFFLEFFKNGYYLSKSVIENKLQWQALGRAKSGI